MSRPRRSYSCTAFPAAAPNTTLIRALADEFHLIAPDYIRFGASKAPECRAIPDPGVFAYTPSRT
jgi:hypothetical protein